VHSCLRNRGNIVGTTRLQAGRSPILSRRGKIFFSFLLHSLLLLRALLSGIKLPIREADHTRPSRDDTEQKWSKILPTIYFNGTKRDSFPFSFLSIWDWFRLTSYV
jgi:hypothetical protein